MKIAIVTGYSPGFAAVGEITTLSMERYAQRHCYDFYCRKDLRDADGSWSKVDILRDLLPRYDAVLWIDSDAAITNPDITIESILEGVSVAEGDRDFIVLSSDINGPNCGVMILGNGFLVQQLLWAVQRTGRWMFDRPSVAHWQDQSAFRFFFQEHPYRDIPRFTATQRVLNSYRNDLYNDGRPYGEESQWQEEDFILHLPGMGQRQRVEVLKGLSL